METSSAFAKEESLVNRVAGGKNVYRLPLVPVLEAWSLADLAWRSAALRLVTYLSSAG